MELSGQRADPPRRRSPRWARFSVVDAGAETKVSIHATVFTGRSHCRKISSVRGRISVARECGSGWVFLLEYHAADTGSGQTESKRQTYRAGSADRDW